MIEPTNQLNTAVRWLTHHRGVVLPLLVVLMMLVVLVPLPPGVMDLLLVTSLTLAVVILLTTITVSSPMEFSVFPSVLLGVTLFRVVLNVATTRLILTAGAHGRDPAQARYAAGKVIWAFSHLVAYDSLAVGVILFAIIFIVQFIVITKGASRISEVSARFMLDAMPGKQMAVDADLNAGLISEDQARHRREAITREADFYGAMDGAGKFIRGDAVSALLITLVNVCGGLYLGLAEYGYTWDQTVDLFTRLTIGDGLVAQVPALIVSIAAGLLVTRSSGTTNLAEQTGKQLLARPAVLVTTAVLLGLLALTPLPALPLLTLGAACIGLAWMLSRRETDAAADVTAADGTASPATTNAPVQDVRPLDPVRVSLGFALVRLADERQDGDLLYRMSHLRQEVAEELGFLTPPVKIHDSMMLETHEYAIVLRGAKVAGGTLYPGQLLAVADGPVRGRLIGRETGSAAFSSGVWIGPSQRARAEMMNYDVLDAAGALTMHLGDVIRRHAAELLSRQQVVALLEGLRAVAPSVVQDVTNAPGVGVVQQVLQGLLRERVSIRDLETILERISEAAARSDRLDLMIDHVRTGLARTLTQQYCGRDGKLWCVELDDDLETAIGRHLERTSGGGAAAVPAALAGKVTEAVAGGLSRLRAQGRPEVLLCSPMVRSAMRELMLSAAPRAAVLGYNEVASAEVQAVAKIGIE